MAGQNISQRNSFHLGLKPATLSVSSICTSAELPAHIGTGVFFKRITPEQKLNETARKSNRVSEEQE
jgi:hypothetical protein